MANLRLLGETLSERSASKEKLSHIPHAWKAKLFIKSRQKLLSPAFILSEYDRQLYPVGIFYVSV